MAKIALRAYNHEISELVDQGQIDEAIAHCRHILQTYPRHIETYRLLGKAYLESQRYGDAADIMQRVLSSVPEDFIAHVGMSIIREDEGNLDAAIWHMERAFEGVPSNQAIQDELRRLYGRRDGREPSRIRLTRGALARMYAHGNLYDQAIAELLAALTEDPQRPDLQALLADTYFQTGKKVEAAETSSKLLAKLPNCLVANRLLSILLAGSERADEAATLRKRWHALEPYAAALASPEDDPARVPDETVNVEHLDYDPGSALAQSGAGGPAWASSLGVDIRRGSEDEAAPDWLSGGSQPAAVGLSTAGEEEEPAWGSFGRDEPAAQEERPDWMAGPPAGAPPAAEDGEVPDWMAQAAPQAPGEETAATETTPDWLSQPDQPAAAAPAETEDTPDWLKLDDAPAPAAAEPEATPDWMAAGQPTGAPAAASEDEEDMSWLEGLAGEAAQEAAAGEAGKTPDWMTEPDAGEPTSKTAEPGIPDFLTEAGWEPGSGEPERPVSILDETKEAGPAGELAPADVPDWIQQLQPTEAAAEDDDFAAALSAAAAATGGTMAWEEGSSQPAGSPGEDTLASFLEETQPTPSGENGLDRLKDAAAEQPQGEEPMTPTPSDDGPDWLKDLSGGSSGDSGDDDLESMDWLDSLTSEVGDQLQAEAAQETATPAPPAAQADDDLESMDWLDSLTSEVGDQLQAEAAQETAATAPPAAQADDDLESMDWLDSLTSEVGDQLKAETAPQDDTPDWLKQIETGPAASPEEDDDRAWLDKLAAEEPIRAEPPTAEGKPAEEMDDALAWMESLAAKHGAAEEELVTPPEARKEEVPDWVLQAAQTPGAPPAPKAPETRADEPEPIPYQPAKQEATPPPSGPGEDLSRMEGMDDALAWLETLAANQGAAEEELVTRPERRTGELPRWVAEESETPAQAAPESTPQEDMAWLNDLADEARSETASDDGAEDWLKRLESETPAEAAPSTDRPSWLDEITEEDRSAEEAGPAVPEWLQAVAEEPAPEAAAQPPQEADSGTWVPEEELPAHTEKAAPAPAAARPTPVRTPARAKAGTAGKTDDIRLAEARHYLAENETEKAADQYGKLSARGRLVDEVIADLREALRRHPVDPALWQALGDAYTRKDMLQEAMDAYTKAEDLLRF